jgi:hypothetical protein
MKAIGKPSGPRALSSVMSSITSKKTPFLESLFQPNCLLTNRLKWETIHICAPMLILGVELRVKMNYMSFNIRRIGGGNAIDNQIPYRVATSTSISNPMEELGIFVPLF